MGRILTHELGHTIGLLGDEYVCLDPNAQVCEATYDKKKKPAWPNLSTLDSIKWKDLIVPGTCLPTVVDDPPRVIGAWEGGDYHRYGIYRPQRTCHMDTLASPFCAVCERELRKQIKKRYISSIPCQYLATQETFDLIWNQPQKWRWSWPRSWTCPSSGDALALEDEINYVLKGVPKGFELKILDELGEVVKEGRPAKRDLEVSFKENRAKQYFVELSSREQANGETETLKITAKLSRNRKLQRLP